MNPEEMPDVPAYQELKDQIRDLRQKNDSLYAKYVSLQDAFDRMVNSMVKAVRGDL